MKKEKLNIADFTRKFYALLKMAGGKIKALVCLVFVVEILSFINPYLLKLIIDQVTNFDKDNLGKIIVFILLIFIVNQIVMAIEYGKDLNIVDLIVMVEGNLSRMAQGKMLSLSLGYHEKENTGNKIIKIQRGIDKMTSLIGSIFWDIAPTIAQVVATFAVLMFIDWRFSLIYVVFVPVFLYLTFVANDIVYPQRTKRHKGYEESAGLMAQSIININTVKSFVQEERERKGLAKIFDKIRKNASMEFRTMFRFNWARGIAIDICLTFIMIFGVYLIYMNEITVGSMVFIITISQKAMISLFRISKLYDRVMESSEPVNRLHKLMNEQSDIVNAKNGIKPKGEIVEVEFSGVSFSYSKDRDKALKNVNLKISAGCTTALIGPSGGGKTTLARMVYRHYDPQSGKVLLNRKDLRDYDIFALRRIMAIVPQEVEIFDMTVGENIAYAKPGASLDEIRAAARIANAEEFINKLSHGYDTKVGERGIRLSGGQRQRVGIARAILANPKILIFDEATSSLDSYSERLIQDAMDKVSKNRTVIIIAHRLSTIKKADKIVVLEGGEVVEQGSHHELSRTKGGLYAKLLKLQEFGDID